MTRNIPRRFFAADDLRPSPGASLQVQAFLLPSILSPIMKLSEELRTNGSAIVDQGELQSEQGLSVFLAFLLLLGVVQITPQQSAWRIDIASHLATDVGYVLALALRDGTTIFSDWTRRSRTTVDKLCALEFLHHLELERIRSSKERGVFPEVLNEVPVSFAIIKAYSGKKRAPVYLVEINKDWGAYNFIGGKQERQDAGDFRTTLLREIEEELGIPRSEVKLTPLMEMPVDGYSLSGHRGVLTRYPCMLYQAHFSKAISTRSKDRWLTESELFNNTDQEGYGPCINPSYLSFLFQDLPGGLKDLNFSFRDKLVDTPWYEKTRDVLIGHKQWVVAALGILGSLIGFIKVLLK